MDNNNQNYAENKTFTKIDIIKILENNNIDCEIIDFKYYHFKKIFIKIYENKEYFFLKLCLNKYSINLSKNEEKGYLFFNRNKSQKFNLPSYKKININDNYALSKIEFINGKKGNFFEFKKFYNVDFSENLKQITFNDYINKILNKLPKNKNQNIKLSKIINILLARYDSLLIPLEASHGDFINFNSLKTSNKNYVFDLEFFDKERIQFYDYFHWYVGPIIYNSIKYTNIFNFNKKILFFFLKNLFYHFTKNFNKSINIDKSFFKTLLILYLLERYIFLEFQINIPNIQYLISKEEIKFNNNNKDLILELINKLIHDY
jgi:hypothetical protein